MLLFIAGVVLLIFGGEFFVESSISLASHLEVPRILIGTTLVSLATTAPELAVSARASALGQPGLAIGNAVGSAIANIAFILGLLCVLKPMTVKRRDFRLPSWVMLVMGIVVSVLAIPLLIERWSGIMLLVFGGAYLLFDYRRHRARPGRETETAETGLEIMSIRRSIVLFIIGTLMVVGGSELLCRNGVQLAVLLGVPQIVIGLTMVAFGTSVPELVTAIHAARKGVPDLSLGNVIGANILNLTLVTGTAATIAPLAIRNRAHHVYNFGAMLFVFVLLKIMARTGRRLTRKEGWVLIGCYAAYLVGLMAIRP